MPSPTLGPRTARRQHRVGAERRPGLLGREACPGAGQGGQLHLPLRAEAGPGEPRPVPGVGHELGEPLRQPGQGLQQGRLGPGWPSRRVPHERVGGGHAGGAQGLAHGPVDGPHREAPGRRHPGEDDEHLRPGVGVLVAVEVGRRPTAHGLEARQLRQERRLGARHVQPGLEDGVQADPERGRRRGQGGGREGRLHHGGGAAHQPAGVRLQDAAIDLGVVAQVVGVDDEPAQGRTRQGLGAGRGVMVRSSSSKS
jgi:hypothetical protein